MNAIGVQYSVNKSLPPSFAKLGSILLKTSLIFQIAAVALFALCTAVFHYRCAQLGLTRNSKVAVPLWVMYISTGLILARTVYRTVEYFGFDRLTVGDYSSPILRYEWFFYVFEATLMLLNSTLWSVFHPRRFLPGNNRVYLERDGVTETEGHGWQDDRPKWETFLDPFGCFRGTGKEAAALHQMKHVRGL